MLITVRFSMITPLLMMLSFSSAVKLKVIVHSDQDESQAEETNYDSQRKEAQKIPVEDNSLLPFLKTINWKIDQDEEKTSDRKPTPIDVFFPLLLRQTNVESIFKINDNWYTWSVDKKIDGSIAINYYICYEEPKLCDKIGWERVNAPPKCAIYIISVSVNDRVCVNPFAQEARGRTDAHCENGKEMKTSDLITSCGHRISTLWRFVRQNINGHNKRMDVNKLLCENKEECFVNMEYRIHRDHITLSIGELNNGQTYKSSMIREVNEDEINLKVDVHPKIIDNVHTKAPHSKSKHLSHHKHNRLRPGKNEENESKQNTLPKNDYETSFGKNKIKRTNKKITDDMSREDDISDA